MARRELGRDRGEPPRNWVYGVHPVLELLDSRPGEIERIWVTREERGPVGRVLRRSREEAVPVSRLPREVLARKLGSRAAHQGVAAEVAPVRYEAVERLIEDSRSGAGLLVLVDGVTDEGNLGAILRAAAGAGADGVVLASEGTAGISGHAAKASAGAVERLPVARVAKPSALIRGLRDRGFRAAALDARGATAWDRCDLTGPLLVVLGAEGRGLRPAVREACNEVVAIPLGRGVESLNVAVAAGVLLFEALRQRRQSADGS